jgi:LmbE family N-acetylglucosaminyl deacetylase
LRPTHLHSLGGVDRESWYHLPALVRRLVLLLRRLKPTAVWTHPYEGGHPDHDATAFIVHAARALLSARHRFMLMEFASYHAGHRGQMVCGSFLQPNAACDGEAPVILRSLGQGERSRKRAMFGCYVTQRQVLEAFSVDHESFREAPRYRFLHPPHVGQLLYEQRPWGTTASDWRQRVERAAAQLGLDARAAL